MLFCTPPFPNACAVSSRAIVDEKRWIIISSIITITIKNVPIPADVVTQSGTTVYMGWVARDWRTFCHLGSNSAVTLSCYLVSAKKIATSCNPHFMSLLFHHVKMSHYYFWLSLYICIFIQISVTLTGNPVHKLIFVSSLLLKFPDLPFPIHFPSVDLLPTTSLCCASCKSASLERSTAPHRPASPFHPDKASCFFFPPNWSSAHFYFSLFKYEGGFLELFLSLLHA